MKLEFLILLAVGGVAAYMFLVKPAFAAAPESKATTTAAKADEAGSDDEGAFGLSYSDESGWGFTFDV